MHSKPATAPLGHSVPLPVVWRKGAASALNLIASGQLPWM
jgi:hypothetical protein